jgi:excisionase family DNA binding protein
VSRKLGIIEIVDEREAFFTTATLAKYLALSERYIRELVTSGEIPSYTFGRARRIDPADVESWLESRRDRSAA